ncbi:MAG: hypothetical protein ACREJB_13495 [Planctomycetaceae bacterium]
MSDTDRLETYRGREVVLDSAGPFVYAGTLADFDAHYLVLTDADVHDLRDTTTTREVYVLELKRHGIPANRRRVLVRREDVLSLSALEDVV